MGIITFKWTPENIATMTEMLAKGRTSRQVAEVLRCSRNAVIGKAGRLDIPRNRNNGSSLPRPRIVVSNHDQSPIEKPKPKYLDRVSVQKARRERDAAGIAPTAIPYAERSFERLAQPISAHLSLLELTDKVCKWPIGDPLLEDFYFCGADSTDSSHRSYCSHHASISRGQGNRAEQHAIDGMGGRRA